MHGRWNILKVLIIQNQFRLIYSHNQANYKIRTEILAVATVYISFLFPSQPDVGCI